MKNLLLLVLTIILLSGCEKEPEPEPEPQTLQEFIIGEWYCNRQMVQNHQADLTITFTEDTYILSVDFSEAIVIDFTRNALSYQIIEDKKIRIQYPYSFDSYLVEYDVAWTELNAANMSWTPRPTNEKNLTNNPTILTWTRK